MPSSVSTSLPATISHTTIAHITLQTLCHRAHALGISTREVLGCHTTDDLQSLAKVRYRALARQVHPDAQARRCQEEGLRPQITGYRFRDYTTTYRWIMRLPKAQRIDDYARERIYEPPLPLALTYWERDLGYGWQDVGPYW